MKGTQKNKSAFASHYRQVASEYDLKRSCLHEQMNEKIVKDILATFFPFAKGRQKFLEAGCGTGRFSIFMAERDFDVTALDYSPEMLRITREKLQKQGLKKKVKLVQGDIEKLPFKDNSFDGCFSYAVLRHFSNPQKGIRELIRVTKKGGAIVFDFMNAGYFGYEIVARLKRDSFTEVSEVKNGFYKNYLFSKQKISQLVNDAGGKIEGSRSFINFPSHLILCSFRLRFLEPVLYEFEKRANVGLVDILKVRKI